MFSLTKEQRISNLEEILQQKETKKENLEKEIQGIKNKISRIQNSKEPEKKSTKKKTSTSLNLIPDSYQHLYEYDPSGPEYQPGSDF